MQETNNSVKFRAIACNANPRTMGKQKKRNNKRISLNEKQRIKEDEEFDVAQMQLENKLRKAQGEKLFKNLEEYKAFQEEEEDKSEEKMAESGLSIDIEEDALLGEAGHILVDMMDMFKSDKKRVANK